MNILLCSEFLDIRNKNSHNTTDEKGSGEVVWCCSYYISIQYLTCLV